MSLEPREKETDDIIYYLKCSTGKTVCSSSEGSEIALALEIYIIKSIR